VILARVVVTDRLLELIGQTVDLLEIGEFRDRLVQALHSALPCDWVAISDTGAGPDSDVEFVDPPIAAELLRIFAELAYQNPLRARAERTGDGRPYRFSDVVTPEELHELEIYQRFYRQIGLEHQLACTLPSATGRILAIVLGRKHEDFTDAERALLGDARPFLIQAYRNATRYSDAVAARPPQRGDERAPDIEALCGLGLTRRQAEVLRLLATGASERAIAAQLGLSHRTVQKHLQLCYRRLGVKTRSDASTIAWTV
jgi:DNA-binding CsgD family transcriptional regulator